MAEAVGLYTGIVASVATLLQLSKAVAEYIRNTVGANEQRRELLRDITAVDALLKELERKAKLPEWKNTLKTIQIPDSPLELLESALLELQKKLQQPDNRFKRVTKRLVWHFQKEEYEEILSKIERSKATLSILLNL
jgi:hypothetical protein